MLYPKVFEERVLCSSVYLKVHGRGQRSAWDLDTVPENFRSRGLASRIVSPRDYPGFSCPAGLVSRVITDFESRVPARVPDFSNFVSRSQSWSRKSGTGTRDLGDTCPGCGPLVEDTWPHTAVPAKLLIKENQSLTNAGKMKCRYPHPSNNNYLIIIFTVS